MSWPSLSIAQLTMRSVNEKFNAIEGVTLPDIPGALAIGSVACLLVLKATWSPAIVNANTTAEQTVTVGGLKTTDVVFVNKPTAQAGLGIVGARVSAANTLAVTFANVTGAGITPTAAEKYTIGVIRPV